MKSSFYPIILAGGRGTRFWPLSRKRRAKQLLALEGSRTMLQQTVDRLLPLARPERFWIISNPALRTEILKQVKKLPQRQVVAEPAARNTAPAIGLAAFILLRRDPEAVLGMFPSDHVIGDEKGFRAQVRRAVEIAAAGENMVVMGIRPTRPETGYGYIEVSPQRANTGLVGDPDGRAASQLALLSPTSQPRGPHIRPLWAKVGTEHPARRGPRIEGRSMIEALEVRRFTEKPDARRAAEFVAAGNFFWNSGMFIWRAQTLANALRAHLPKTAGILEQIADAWGTRRFPASFRKLYPKCENISVDYAVLEPTSAQGEGKSGLYCIPAEFGWNDLGSWTALYEHHTRATPLEPVNVIQAENSFALNAEGNYIYSPKKFVAVVGVKGLVVVETGDALLVTSREHAQDVGKVVKYLDEKKLSKLV
jgi:mannose-1-phosphate guanylyltransferase